MAITEKTRQIIAAMDREAAEVIMESMKSWQRILGGPVHTDVLKCLCQYCLDYEQRIKPLIGKRISIKLPRWVDAANFFLEDPHDQR